MFTADWQPLWRLALLASLGALLPLGWWWLRQRGADLRDRLALLTAITLFLTFDLIVFGAFTRLTDSGLGCPDWPGCYGQASPIGARSDIRAAELAQPTGPVTTGKAWIEMLHRYFAMVVGVLILVAAAVSWRARRVLPHSPWWATATLAWVIVQGLFGKYTVTLKLYPAVVTLHLLGAMLLLALLVLQHESFRDRPLRSSPGVLPVALVLGVVALQVALGGWVSTNYAVLACTGFPSCNGQWWPAMDAAQGFTLLRQLGQGASGDMLPVDALVAIHVVHRVFALAVTGAVGALAYSLWRSGDATAGRYGRWLALLVLLQVLTGVSNVVLGWPIAAALLHSAGAAALVGVLTSLLARVYRGERVGAAAMSTGPATASTAPGWTR
jgi:heme a synthase